ncbi:ABC1-domain-containing protein [Diplogelasinospora grovesii]|uniref:ABC1-domain-containing protein n=1 Tax=Diplogelasinospora grovesii TaxID=303347 RepID=A0AAN6N7Z0_9PEZI|nr:ABC1-domain-containing protein [Diplogelasinospora grovesii]
MRFGDLLVDLAAVASATRSVASKHVALRARQLDRYSKTSSIIAASRGQRQQTQQPGWQQQQHDQYSEPQTEDGAKADTAAEEPPANVSRVADVNATPSESQGDFPSMRVGNLPPRSAPVTPASTTASTAGPNSQQSVFKPAPWATGSGGILHQTTATPRHPPQLPRKPVRSILGNDGAELTSDSIDVNIFRTSRGSKILDSLKEPSEAGSEAEVSVQSTQKTVKDEEPVIRKAPTDTVTQTKESIIEAPPAVTEIVPPKADQIPLNEPKGDVATSEPTTTAGNAAEAEKKLSQEDANLIADLTGSAPPRTGHNLRESKVPSSRISRLWNYGGLAAGMFAGAIGEGLSRAVGGGGQGSLMLSAGNMERLVAKLSRMRGAALKLGQLMSFQDSKMLPAPIQEVLQRVQDRADYMPAWQRDRVLVSNLGPEWRDLFDEFEEKPIAAASIGQVHRATLKSNGQRVAVKIQFPGVADSINSDLDNLSILLAATKLLPKGLYLNKTIDNARTELGWECDYDREAQCGQRYRELLSGEDDVFVVPQIYPEACGKQVLTMEFMDGVGVTRVTSFTQEQKDWIGTQLLRLCLREITEFKFMQTDPNWTNFLYNAEKNKLELLDFGASREYPDKFITLYVQLLEAASRSDREQVKALSEELGYLTGHESKVMLDAHVTSVLTLAEPFLQSAPEVYDFRDQTITERVKGLIPIMIHERLAPPPEETYSLHRKLSGAFLLCARLGSRVRCRELFEDALKKTDLVAK